MGLLRWKTLVEVMGVVKVPPIDRVKKKWEERAGMAEDDYRYGIQNSEDWQSKTLNAAKNWEAGIQQAIREKRFETGVSRVTTEEWRRKAIEKGARRFVEGVRTAVEDYGKAMGEVLRVLEGITLPERGPRGDPKNIDRVRVIAETLHKWRVSRKA